jgi:hypothetical protein
MDFQQPRIFAAKMCAAKLLLKVNEPEHSKRLINAG